MPPVGFKRSRALWDDARRPRPPDRKKEHWMSLLRAILYELQPVRFSEYQQKVNPAAIASSFSTRVWPGIRHMGTTATRVWLPALGSILRNLTARQCMMVGGVVIYYFAVRWIHELLDAGPLVLIMTALAIIFTVGLGERAEGEMSAYSVFNRGFQKLMGSVDVEALVNQHVGGGMMLAGGVGDDAAGIVGGGINEEDAGNRRPQRRGNNNLHNARRNEEGGEQVNHDVEDNDDDNNDGNGEYHRGQARKSGKKNRRRNQEEREDQRRQREAARALGLDGTGGQEEAVAMQQLNDNRNPE